MLGTRVRSFAADQSGSYTIWGLVWFMLFVGIGGLAVDITDAYRNKTLLQATADSSALAAVMSLDVTGEQPEAQANAYASANMQIDHNGDVLADTDITVGNWDFNNATFTAGGTDPNAVYVMTRRSSENANPLATNFLRIVGLRSWDIVADSVAVTGVDVCFNNGIIAGNDLDIKTHTRFWRNICLIGEQGLLHRDNGNFFEEGVYAGVGCDGGCLGPNETLPLRNDGFARAFGMASGGNYRDPTRPENALRVGKYLNAVLDLPTFPTFQEFLDAYNDVGLDYSGYEYLVDPQTNQVAYDSVSSLPAEVTTGGGQYTVYEVNCGSNFVLPDGTYRNVAIVVNCRLRLSGDYDMSNVLIASTHTGGSAAIHASGHTDLGAATCGAGGVEMYALGDIHFAAAGTISNTRILSGGSIHFAAAAQGPIGVHIEAVEDVFVASGSNSGADFGLCPNNFVNGAHVLSYSLVR